MRVQKLSLIICMAVLFTLTTPSVSPAQECVATGDVDCSGGAPNNDDLILIIDFFDGSHTLPPCPEQMDVNGDCVVDWSDYQILLGCITISSIPCPEVATCCDPKYNYSCCVNHPGDANGNGNDEPTIGDVSVLIDALFIGADFSVLPCLAEADFNFSGGCDPIQNDITIGDISLLIEYLFFGSFDPIGLPHCLDCP